MQAVVITGLAQGIGREVATLLARSKVPVAGFDVDKEGIESLKEEFEKAGCDCLLTTVDIADRPGILKFRDQVLAKFGRVDVVLVRRRHHPAAPTQLHQQRHTSMGRHLLGQAARQVNVQGFG